MALSIMSQMFSAVFMHVEIDNWPFTPDLYDQIMFWKCRMLLKAIVINVGEITWCILILEHSNDICAR